MKHRRVVAPLPSIIIVLILYIYFAHAAPQGPNFRGLNPHNKPGRFVDGILCPKDVIGEYTRNKSFCHRIHIGWHKISEVVDRIFGGSGEFDRQRYEAHREGLKRYKSKQGFIFVL